MEQRIPATVLKTVPYDQMVRNLFKDMGSKEASFLHAAIGISGETAELLVANSIENIVEELGTWSSTWRRATKCLAGAALH